MAVTVKHKHHDGTLQSKPAEGQDEPDSPPPPNPIYVSPEKQEEIKKFDKYTRTRLSKNFIMRDFLYSSRAEILGLSNRPSDNPRMVIKAGKALCEKVLEPLLAKFGQFAITYGYQSRKLIEAGYKPVKNTSSAPHQWDRGTFGKNLYARVDILLYSVEDGEHTKHEVATWMMANLDIDLLMLWQGSNVMCITVSVKPRRVYLEWVPYGKGEGGSNKITYMGEYYWQTVWPGLQEHERPAFGPSLSEGKMYFGK